jgi:tRNA (adenine22-N1)-methyltransferase
VEPAHRRLAALVDLVPEGSVVAEVGTDRGVLARWLVTSGRARRCIATELDGGRLRRAHGLPPTHPSSCRLELRAGDGLAPLAPADGVEVLVLAGLGGPAICRILDGARVAELGIGRILLDSRTELAAVREKLMALSFGIEDERVVTERGRYFTLILGRVGVANGTVPAGLSERDRLEAGPLLLAQRCPVARELWRADLSRLERILARPGSGPAREAALARRAAALRILGWLDGDRAAV